MRTRRHGLLLYGYVYQTPRRRPGNSRTPLRNADTEQFNPARGLTAPTAGSVGTTAIQVRTARGSGRPFANRYIRLTKRHPLPRVVLTCLARGVRLRGQPPPAQSLS